jgi:hypothetical protein
LHTTPHLFAWLIFTGRLGDSDHGVVASQHKALEGDLGPHLETAYGLALQCLLNSRAAVVVAVPPLVPKPPPDMGRLS